MDPSAYKWRSKDQPLASWRHHIISRDTPLSTSQGVNNTQTIITVDSECYNHEGFMLPLKYKLYTYTIKRLRKNNKDTDTR